MSKNVQESWYPVVGTSVSQLVAESEEAFSLVVNYGADDVERLSSLHDGLLYFVAVDVPAGASVALASEEK